jgi:hypothetical protein
MKTNQTFSILLLIARPAAGKSEIIEHLKNLPLEERIRRYHIGKFEVIDDFPMIWTWFEEDNILTRLGYPRLHTDRYYYFLYPYLWDVLIERIGVEYQKKLAENPNYHQEYTSVLEFSRGAEHGGFTRAFQHLNQSIIEKMALLYINVSWEESFRKNKKRYNPDRRHSILEHGLPDRKLKDLYRHSDWETLSADDPEFIEIKGVRVPYVVFENEDDVTTQGGEALIERLEETLGRLWELRKEFF